MAGNALHYYACGNTAKGFVTLMDTGLKGLSTLYILRGGTPRDKTDLLRQIGAFWLQGGADAEYLHCALDEDALDGVILRGQGFGVVNGDAPHVIHAPQGVHCIDCRLGSAAEAGETEAVALSQAYAAFAEALAIHDDWEKVYISNMDREAHNRATQELIDRILAGYEAAETPAPARHRFMGGATPAGPVDYIPNLTEGVAKRFFLKGRPGTGKSTLLKRLAAEAQRCGIAPEVYHCGFDPDSLDMVILRELGIVVVDTTAPHEYFPDRVTDEVFDLYEKCIRPGTDEENADRLREIAAAYKAAISRGTAALMRAKQARLALEPAAPTPAGLDDLPGILRAAQPVFVG